MSTIDFTGYEKYPQTNGAINIVLRKYFEKVGGFDERFKGWGGEDDAFMIAMCTLCGSFSRPKGTKIWHLYHPKEPLTNYVNNLELLNKVYRNRDSVISDLKQRSNK